MIIVKPSVYILSSDLDKSKLSNIERFGRVCYKSEGLIGQGSSEDFVAKLLARGHESVIEHEKATVKFIVDRGITHEIVRHRIASYSQESTRYCNYSSERFGKEISVISPFFFETDQVAYEDWKSACEEAERRYISLIEKKRTPQEARSVLPNSLKTEIVVTYNFREWRHFFRLRCAKEAHPQMRQVTIPLLLAFLHCLPVLFNDIKYDTDFPKEHYAEVKMTDEL